MLQVEEEGVIPYVDAIVCFYERSEDERGQKLKWKLRGRFDGYETKKGEHVGYIEVPISGYSSKLVPGSELGERYTLHPKQDRRQMRIVWQYLMEKGFEMEEINQEKETSKE